MNIQPCFDNVLIEPYEYEPKNEPSIYLTGNDESTTTDAFARVLDCNENDQGVVPGSIILVDKFIGFPFTIDRKKYRMIQLKQVIAVLSGPEFEKEKPKTKVAKKVVKKAAKKMTKKE